MKQMYLWIIEKLLTAINGTDNCINWLKYSKDLSILLVDKVPFNPILNTDCGNYKKKKKR